MKRSEELVLSKVPQQDELQTGVYDELVKAPYDFYIKYGDSYISSIFYGNEIEITIKFSEVSSEVKKKLEGLLEVGLQNGVGFKQATSLDSFAKKHQLKYEIQVSCVGFKLDLPPLMTSKLSALVEWMQKFEAEYNKSVPTEKEQSNILYYETASYNNIFGSVVTPLLRKARDLEKIHILMIKCKAAISYYDNYYKFVPDSNQDDHLAKISESLKNVEQDFDLNQSSGITKDDLKKVLTNLNNNVIHELNQLRPDPIERETLEFKYSGIRGKNATTIIFRTKHFKLAYPELQHAFSHYSINVKSTNDLHGKLALNYSWGWIRSARYLTKNLITPLVKGENNVPIKAILLPQDIYSFAVFYTPSEDEVKKDNLKDLQKIEDLKNDITIQIRYNYNRLELIPKFSTDNIENIAKRLESLPDTKVESIIPQILLFSGASFKTNNQKSQENTTELNADTNVDIDARRAVAANCKNSNLI